MSDVTGQTDKTPEWEERHPNPSGLPDQEPLIHEFGGVSRTARKVPQPIPESHHEEGHVDPDDYGGTPQ